MGFTTLPLVATRGLLKLLNLRYINSACNFITIIFSDDHKAFNFVQSMLIRGVIIRHLKSFGLSNCVRISIGTMEENKIFIKNLKEIINE